MQSEQPRHCAAFRVTAGPHRVNRSERLSIDLVLMAVSLFLQRCDPLFQDDECFIQLIRLQVQAFHRTEQVLRVLQHQQLQL